tara:strand:+ start:132 stop:656 length:525 start_codon:yes stop_codon:yes gene_type:complete
MILECKSCQKKFVVPDSAITSGGRLVQCSACGNKWVQYPSPGKVKKEIKSKISEPKLNKLTKKTQRKNISKQKKTGPSIYSREYLEKKHGIKINENSEKSKRRLKSDQPSSTGALGFYSYFLILIVLVLTFFGILNLTKEIIILNFPITENYINYFYENLDNFLILFKDLFNLY